MNEPHIITPNQNNTNPQPTPILGFTPENFTPSPPPTPKSNKKKIALIAIIIILLLSAAGAAWFFLLKDKDQTTPSPEPTATKAPEQTGSLFYVYKEGKKSTIRSVNLSDNKTEDLKTFNEANEVPKENSAVYNDRPEADMTNDLKRVAYIDENNIRQLELSNKQETTTLTATKQENSIGNEKTSSLTISPAPTLPGGPPGIFTVMFLDYSKDGNSIMYSTGQYEGYSTFLLDILTNKYVSLGDTFRYTSEVYPKDSYTATEANTELVKRSLSPGLAFKEDATPINFGVYSSDNTRIYGILCPLDKPNSGNSTYLATESETLKYQRDCGEKEPSTLFYVNAAGGKITNISEKVGLYGLSYYKDQLFVGNPDKQVEIYSALDNKLQKTVDVIATAKLDKTNVSSMLIENVQKPLAILYHKDGAKQKATIVDIAENKVLTTLDLADQSKLKLLGISS